jgi:hypothetical protein
MATPLAGAAIVADDARPRAMITAAARMVVFMV